MTDANMADYSSRTASAPASGAATRRATEPDDTREFGRPATAPAYYLGRPARMWLTHFRPHFRRANSQGSQKAKPSNDQLSRQVTSLRLGL
jgi:hypothetical protein